MSMTGGAQGLSHFNYANRKANQPMLDGILYNSRQEKAAEKTARNTTFDDSASVASYSSTSGLLKSKFGSSIFSRSEKPVKSQVCDSQSNPAGTSALTKAFQLNLQ